MKFKVRDKEHTLGVVIMSLASLGAHRESSKKWFPLTPHKKGHETVGELLVECFVSQFRPGQMVSLSETSSPVLSRRGSQEEIFVPPNTKKGGGVRRFSLHRRTPSWSKGSAAESPVSVGSEHRQLGGGGPHLEGTGSVRSGLETVSCSSEGSASRASALQPQVTGISPHEGPVQGGQRVVLRGCNLGDSRESVLKVMVADVDCTGSLEYFSPSKQLLLSLSVLTVVTALALRPNPALAFLLAL